MQLKNKNLLKSQAYINGEWVDHDKLFGVTNPANGEKITHVVDLDELVVHNAIDAAHDVFESWKNISAKERAKILRKWADLMIENQDDLAAIMTAEQGKPLAESKGEIGYAASFLEWFAEEGKRAYGDVIPSPIANSRIVVVKQPVGVCGIITPWNFPSAMITRKVGAALGAGCTVVAKPASETPLSALALAVLAEEAGVPPGVFNVVTSSNSKAIGKLFCEAPAMKKISFTGSTAVGKILVEQAAGTLKKMSMELGGNAPFIVFDDADIDAAVDGAVICKFRNAGQTCVCANRIYVHASIYDEFAQKFAAKVKALKVGNGAEDGVQVGPLINEKAISKVQEFVTDAVGKGAKVETGGKKHGAGDLFFEPTVLTGVTSEMKVSCDEIFGPVAPLYKFQDEAEVIKLANNTQYGLASYFYARDHARVWRVAEALQYGMVAINTPILSTEVAPFGGIKESGFGREGSKYGLEDYLNIKYMLMAGL